MDSVRSFINKIMVFFLKITGKRPLAFAYNIYKWRMIEKYLKLNLFNEGNLTQNYGTMIDERIIEYPWLLSRLPEEKGILLDAGSALNFEQLLCLPIIQSKKIFISTLAPEKNSYWKNGISYVYEDLRNTCYKENNFDWIVSISTLEHIGLDNTTFYTDDPRKKENLPSSYLSAVREFYRILKPGGILFITVPYGQYRNHGWFQVFDEDMIEALITTFSPSSYLESHFQYLDNSWQKSTRQLSKDAPCFDIQKKSGTTSEISPFSRAVICLELKK